MIKNMEFKSKGVVAMLDSQKTTPYYEDSRVDELLRTYPDQTTQKMAVYMYMLGYINGKTCKRARKKQKNKR